jgi:dihydrofolate reductase
MGKIVISANVSLDGVFAAPDGKEDSARGDWFFPSLGEDAGPWGQALLEEARGTEALLLGRRSDEWFAARWAARDGEYADLLNKLPKYVVSGTIETPRWGNGTVLSGDPAEAAASLRDKLSGNIVVYGSGQLGRTLLEQDLVDELRLFVLPVVVGAGQRLFGALSGQRPMRLAGTRVLGRSLLWQAYERSRGQ